MVWSCHVAVPRRLVQPGLEDHRKELPFCSGPLLLGSHPEAVLSRCRCGKPVEAEEEGIIAMISS